MTRALEICVSAARWAVGNRPRTDFRKRDGVQARKLERVGSLIPGKPTRATARPEGQPRGVLHGEGRGGGDAKAFPRCAGEYPGS